jgi:hypothetical protein
MGQPAGVATRKNCFHVRERRNGKSTGSPLEKRNLIFPGPGLVHVVRPAESFRSEA